ncbi:hypothetical protein, partial [Burkholderia ambifaria]|uniref:hypothetical protein n=1 Tax=Burkholderia ambifaria TaxID=152480 RepID=UPI0012FE1B02
ILAASALPVWAWAEIRPSAPAPAGFVDMSAALLGIDRRVLEPPVQPDDMCLSSAYYDLATRAAPDGMIQLMREFERRVSSGQSEAAIAHALLTAGADLPRPDAVGTFARLTMLMWLFGVWYGATECVRQPAARAHITDEGYQSDFVVSARAYRAGWIWKIAQAHPPGFSQFSFGSWADPAPSLAEYGIRL